MRAALSVPGRHFGRYFLAVSMALIAIVPIGMSSGGEVRSTLDVRVEVVHSCQVGLNDQGSILSSCHDYEIAVSKHEKSDRPVFSRSIDGSVPSGIEIVTVTY